MSKYFVIGFRKITSEEEYKNKIVGHNHRSRHYPNRPNIDTTKSKDNIVLEELKYKSANDLINVANQIIKQENIKIRERNNEVEDKEQKEKLRRGLKKGSAFCYEILIDCSVILGWKDDNYINYLKEANEWCINRFKGQELISSVIHLDESKPHLHITFSYFNTDLKKWNQRGMREQNLTNINLILKDFEKEIGQKFGLKKGDNEKLKKEIKKEFTGTKYKVKTEFLKTEEKVLVNGKDLNTAINKIYSRVKSIGTEARYQQEILELKKKHEQEKYKITDTYEQEILQLKNVMRDNNKKIRELEKEIEEQKDKIRIREDIINRYKRDITNIQDKLYALKHNKQNPSRDR